MQYLGFGLGLRAPHYRYVLENQPCVDWFEIVSENFFVQGGQALYYLDKIRELYPMVMHGVSLSIGSANALNFEYLQQLRTLADRVKPAWISDHLCWTGVGDKNTHDLLPLPHTEEAIAHVVSRVQQVQDFLGQRIALENISSYVSFAESEMPEWEFLTAIAERADCWILLDVNNIYVNAYNYGFDAQDYLRGIAAERVLQFHIAGHTNKGKFIIDSHDEQVVPEVWALYADAIRRFGRVSTMIERDENIPVFSELMAELQQARSIAQQVMSENEIAKTA